MDDKLLEMFAFKVSVLENLFLLLLLFRLPPKEMTVELVKGREVQPVVAFYLLI